MCKDNLTKPKNGENPKPVPAPVVRTNAWTRQSEVPQKPNFDYEKDFPKIKLDASRKSELDYIRQEEKRSRSASTEYKLAIGSDPSPSKKGDGHGSAYAEYKCALRAEPQHFRDRHACGSSDREYKLAVASKPFLTQNPVILEMANSEVKMALGSGVAYQENSAKMEKSFIKYPTYAAVCRRNDSKVSENIASVLDSMVENSLPSQKSGNDFSILQHINSNKLAQEKSAIKNLEYEREWTARLQLEQKLETEKYQKKLKEIDRLKEIEITCSFINKENLKPNVTYEPGCQERIRKIQNQRQMEENCLDPDHFTPPRDKSDLEFMSIPRKPYHIYNENPPKCEPFKLKHKNLHPKVPECENAPKETKNFVSTAFAHLRKTFAPGKHSKKENQNSTEPQNYENDNTPVDTNNESNSSSPTTSYPTEPRTTTDHVGTASDPTVNVASDFGNETESQASKVMDSQESCYMAVVQSIMENEYIINAYYTDKRCKFNSCSICTMSSEIDKSRFDISIQHPQSQNIIFLLCQEFHQEGENAAQEVFINVLQRFDSDKDKYHPKLATSSATIGSCEHKLTCSNCQNVALITETGGPLCLSVTASLPGTVKEQLHDQFNKGENVRYKCVFCNERTISERTLKFKTLPDVMLVAVNRSNPNNLESLNPMVPSPDITVNHKNGFSYKYKLATILCYESTRASSGYYYMVHYDSSLSQFNDETDLINCKVFVYNNTNFEDKIVPNSLVDSGITHAEFAFDSPENAGNVDELSDKFSHLYKSPELGRGDSNSGLPSSPNKIVNNNSIAVHGESSGLHNYGTSCYLSCVLQTIANNAVLRDYFCTSQKCGEEQCSICVLTDEVEAMFKTSGFHRPDRLWNLRSDLNLEFERGQHDAQEFMLCLFERLQMDKILYHHELSLLEDPMTMILDSTVICSGCNNESTTEQRLGILHIPVVTNQTVQNQVTQYLEPEENAEFQCEKCKVKGNCSIRKKVTKLPLVSIVLLQRFKNESQKNCNPIVANKEITMIDESGNSVPYTLGTAILHSGNSLTQGHYTNILVQQNHAMFYNDHKKTKIKSSQIPNNSTYMLIYNIANEKKPQKNPIQTTCSPVTPTPVHSPTKTVPMSSTPIQSRTGTAPVSSTPTHIPNKTAPVSSSQTHSPIKTSSVSPTPVGTQKKSSPMSTSPVDTKRTKKRPRENSDSENQEELPRAFPPYSTKVSNYTAKDVNSILSKFDVKNNTDQLITLPPLNAKAGDVYLYVRQQQNDRDYVKDGYFGFHHDGSKFRPPGVRCESYKLMKENTKIKDREFVEGFQKFCYYLEKDMKKAGTIVLIHYVGDEKLYHSRAHGHSKKDKAFVSNTKAAKQEIEKSLRAKATPQHAFNKQITELFDKYQEKYQQLEPVIAVRNRKQVYNINHNRKLAGRLTPCEIFNILEIALQDYGSMIHDIVLYPDEGFVFGDPANIYLAKHLLKRCAKDPTLPQLLSYDTTFNLGDAYLSCIVMRNVYFEGDPLFPILYLIHNRKAAESHRWLFNRFDILTSFSKHYSDSIPIISDREQAIKTGIVEVLKSKAYLFCHNHILSDIKVWLKKNNAKNEEIVGLSLEIKCLLYSKTEDEFSSLYSKYMKKWDSSFLDYINTSVLPDIKASAEYKYKRFTAFNKCIPTNNLSESLNNKIKSFLTRKELPIDSLLLGLHQLQIEQLRDFQRSYGTGGSFVPKTDCKNTIDSLQLPDYINLSSEKFMELFQPARPQDLQKTIDHRMSQKALAKLCHEQKLITFDILSKCYNVRSPYKHNINTVFQNTTGKLQCTCISKFASKCYHIIASELFSIDKPREPEKPRIYQLSALRSRFRKAVGIGRAGRRAPRPVDEDFATLPAPTSLAAKLKSPLIKVVPRLKKDNANSQNVTSDKPKILTKIKQGLKFSKTQTEQEKQLKPPSKGSQFTSCSYIMDECIDTLDPAKWISGYVLDAALRLTVLKHNLTDSVLVFSHALNEIAFNDQSNASLACRIFEHQPLNYNMILIPMGLKPGYLAEHWVLGVFMINTKNIIIMDSLKVSNVDRCSEFKRLAKLAAGCFISAGIDVDIKDFNCIFARESSIQTNTFDCGIHVIKNAEAILGRNSLQYTCESNKERLRIRDFILQKDIEEDCRIKNPRDIYPYTVHRLLSKRASALLPRLSGITLQQRIRTQDITSIFNKDFSNSKLNWTKCSAKSCQIDLNKSKHQEGCALCRKWFHYTCELLKTDETIHPEYFLCQVCFQEIRKNDPTKGVDVEQISDGSNIGNPITVEDSDEEMETTSTMSIEKDDSTNFQSMSDVSMDISKASEQTRSNSTLASKDSTESVDAPVEPVEDLLKILQSLDGESGNRCLLTLATSEEELLQTFPSLRGFVRDLYAKIEAHNLDIPIYRTKLERNRFLMFTKHQLNLIREEVNNSLGDLWIELNDDEESSRKLWHISRTYHLISRIHVHASLSNVDFHVAYKDALDSELALATLEEKTKPKEDAFEIDTRDLTSLGPLERLSPEVLYLSLLAYVEQSDMKEQFLVLPFKFYKWSATGQYRMLAKHLNLYEPLSFNYIVLPVNTKTDASGLTSSWLLGIIAFEQKKIILMDSDVSDLQNRNIQFVALLKVALTCYLTSGLDVQRDMFEAIYSQDCPKHKISEDSGIFAITNFAALLQREGPCSKSVGQDRIIVRSLLDSHKDLVPEECYSRNKAAIISPNLLSNLELTLVRTWYISGSQSNTNLMFDTYFEKVSHAPICSKSCSTSSNILHKCVSCRKYFHPSCELLKKPVRVSASYKFCDDCYSKIEIFMDTMSVPMEMYSEILTAQKKKIIYTVPATLGERCQKCRSKSVYQLMFYFTDVANEIHNIVSKSHDLEFQTTFRSLRNCPNLDLLFQNSQMTYLNETIQAKIMKIIDNDKENTSSYAVATDMISFFMKLHVYARINKIEFEVAVKDIEQLMECKWISSDLDDELFPEIDLE